MLMTYGATSRVLSHPSREKISNREYFYLMIKALRRIFAAITVAVLAFRAVGSFLSWVEHQEDTVADAWVDEDEFEDA